MTLVENLTKLVGVIATSIKEVKVRLRKLENNISQDTISDKFIKIDKFKDNSEYTEELFRGKSEEEAFYEVLPFVVGIIETAGSDVSTIEQVLSNMPKSKDYLFSMLEDKNFIVVLYKTDSGISGARVYRYDEIVIIEKIIL